jgi:Ni,Fe-hydrogenase III large subunit
MTAVLELENGACVEQAQVPVVDEARFRDEVIRECGADARLVTLFGRRLPDRAVRIHALLAHDEIGMLTLIATDVLAGGGYRALTPEVPEAERFEREIAEEYGLAIEGHPWLRPVRSQAPDESAHATPGRDPPRAPGDEGRTTSYFTVAGEGIHEVAVGPVHAGIIEPGHFRFQCDGERVLHLEIRLGYQHRGAAKLLVSGDPRARIVTAESIAGDSVIAHALAHCHAVEALAGTEVPLRAQALRAIALELERVANHIGDLGALANDIAYLSAAAWFGRLRGDATSVTLELTGNRYGRGFLRPGGVTEDLDPGMAPTLVSRLQRLDREFRDVCELFFRSNPVLARLEAKGTLDYESAETLGLVGPSARASGCDRDVRRDHPLGFFRFAHIPTVRLESGDIYARALIRRLDALHSLAFLVELMNHVPRGELRTPIAPVAPDSIGVAMTEGWRGETVHLLFTDRDGGYAEARVIDPSFHNWIGLALAMRGGEISDFPLCNKSFNLSYAGHDL